MLRWLALAVLLCPGACRSDLDSGETGASTSSTSDPTTGGGTAGPTSSGTSATAATTGGSGGGTAGAYACGWSQSQSLYTCGCPTSSVDPDGTHPRECPAGLMDGADCPDGFTDVGCCDDELQAEWWCEAGKVMLGYCGDGDAC